MSSRSRYVNATEHAPFRRKSHVASSKQALGNPLSITSTERLMRADADTQVLTQTQTTASDPNYSEAGYGFCRSLA
ncbi:MAG TPA: hypothetical protein VG297_07555 [Bryobacteraceae bacterium]|nr:hypothetical protein [Bryobacteraceae bacterium]